MADGFDQSNSSANKFFEDNNRKSEMTARWRNYSGFNTFCAEHMSGDKRTVEVRPVRFGDYEAVLAIPGDFFRGRDYLPKMFHIFLQDKNSNCFVILLNGRIVGFQNNYIVEDGTRYVKMGVRIAEDCRGLGLSRVLAAEAEVITVKRHPALQYVSWSAVNHPAQRDALLNNPQIRVVLSWTCYAYNITCEDLERTPNYLPQDVPIHSVKQLNLSQSYRILTDPVNQRNLFPDEYFGVTLCWMPYLVNNRNLRMAALTNDVTVTFSADGSSCESLAFHSLLPVRDGATRVGVWIYGRYLSARLAAAHVMYWLQTPLNANVSKQLKLLLQLPRHVNQEEFKSHLVEKIGKPEFSEAFDTDECITVMKQIS